MNDILAHHGILGQKWGVRRYQNPDGSLTSAGKKRYHKAIDKLRKLDEKREKVLEKLEKDDKPYYLFHPNNPLGRTSYYDLKNHPAYQQADYRARKWYKKMEKTFKNVKIEDISSVDKVLMEKYLKQKS